MILYGRGLSERPDAPHTRNFYDAQPTQLLNELGISEPFDLVGTSQGGAILSTFAARHSQSGSPGHAHCANHG
jgi:pimeloyl-ACP methyl ester carboxylesterase